MALWLAMTMMLVGLILPIRTSTAEAQNTSAIADQYPSTVYEDLQLSVIESRFTSGEIRECSISVCDDVVVVDLVVSNTGSVNALLAATDLSLINSDGELTTASRLDCAGKVVSTVGIATLLGGDLKCSERAQQIVLKPNSSQAVALLFEVNQDVISDTRTVELKVVESHRRNMEPAIVSIG